MTATDWDNTPWGGTAVADKPAAKAAVGWQSIYTNDRVPITSLSRSPMKRMRSEQALYWTNPWILTAEDAVTRRVAGLPWHLDDDQDDEIEDETPDTRLKQIKTLLEKPQAALSIEERQVGIESWTNLVSITSRHLGLCGMTHWYLDSLDGAGIPNALLYLNPARMFPQTTSSGRLVQWILDPLDEEGRGGTPLQRREVLTFYLKPPDAGAISSGYVQAAYLKARITTATDVHIESTMGQGGRRGGVVSPKSGTLNDDEYKILTQEIRSSQELDDGQRRIRVIRGPVDFNETSADLSELDVVSVSNMTRDNILITWGVPGSQVGVPGSSGLNSGETKGYDEAVLMQGAVHDRVRPIRETIQLGLLDRWNAQGLNPQLVIEEPTFDDETPAYTLATLAKDQPLTRNERRAILKLDPLPEYGPDGEPLGLAIDLPFGLHLVGQGEESEKKQPVGRFGRAPQADPVVLPNPAPQLLPGEAKAADIRSTVVRRFEPVIRKAIAGFLAEQRNEIAGRIRDKGEHVAKKPGDKSVWFDAKRWNAKLTDALRQGIVGVSEAVTTKVTAQMGRAKADPFSESVAEAVLRTVALRVVGINDTTRDAIAALIGDGFADGLSPSEVAALIEDATPFNASRAEVIARTETATTYNQAAIASYNEYGVTHVEVIDGDEDDECATANGSVWTLEEADADPLGHPNCVRDFSPVAAAKATFNPSQRAMELATKALEAFVNQPAPVNHFYPPDIHIPPTVVNVTSPDVYVDGPVVNIPPPLPVRKVVERDTKTGQIIGVTETNGT